MHAVPLACSLPSHARRSTAARSCARRQLARLAADLQVPPNRWDVDTGWPGEHALPKRFGSFVEDAELFDCEVFGLSSQEVRCSAF